MPHWQIYWTHKTRVHVYTAAHAWAKPASVAETSVSASTSVCSSSSLSLQPPHILHTLPSTGFGLMSPSLTPPAEWYMHSFGQLYSLGDYLKYSYRESDMVAFIWNVFFDWGREMWHTYHNGTSNGPNVECLFTVTHVQSSSGMLTGAANANYPSSVQNVTFPYIFFMVGGRWRELMKVCLQTVTDTACACALRSYLSERYVRFKYCSRGFVRDSGPTLLWCCCLGIFDDSITPPLTQPTIFTPNLPLPRGHYAWAWQEGREDCGRCWEGQCRMDPIVSPTGHRVLSHPGKYHHLDYACSQVCFLGACMCQCVSAQTYHHHATATALFGCSFPSCVSCDTDWHHHLNMWSQPWAHL